MLLWVMGVGFEYTCTILRKVKCLLGYSNTLWMAILNFKTPLLLVELQVPNEGDTNKRVLNQWL